MLLNIWKNTGFLKEMTVREAMKILGVSALSTQAVNRNYREIVRRNHPDAQGSAYLAQKINEARELLLSNTK